MHLRRFLFLFLACFALGPPLLRAQAVVTGTITGSQCVQIDVTGKGVASISVTNSASGSAWSGTIQPQVSVGGDPAQNTAVYPTGSTTSQSTITSNNVYQSASVSGATLFQVCGNTVTNTANVKLTAVALATMHGGGGGGGTNNPGGSPGQIQTNAGGSAFGGFTASGDCTINTTTGAVTCTKTNGTAFGTAATANLTNTTSFPFQSLTTSGSSGAASLSGGVLNIPQYTGGGGTSLFSGLTPGINTTAAAWGIEPSTALGGSAPYFTVQGVTADTDTGAVVNFDTASGSQQNAFRVGIDGTSQFQVCWQAGPQGEAVFGSTVPCTSIYTTTYAKNIFQSSTNAHTLIREWQSGAGQSGPFMQMNTATAAGTGFNFLEGWTGVTGTDTFHTGGTESFYIRGDGLFFGSAYTGSGPYILNSSCASLPTPPVSGFEATIDASCLLEGSSSGGAFSPYLTVASFPGAGLVPWSILQNATAPLVLANAGNATTFNQTSGVAWTWANTTAAISGTSQYSPISAWCGTEWHAAASAVGCINFQFQPGNGTDAASVANFSHSGAATGARTYQFDGSVASSVSGGVGSALFLTQEGTVPSGVSTAAQDNCYGDSTQHGILCNFNAGTTLPIVQGPASDTAGHLATWSGTNGGKLIDGGAQVVTSLTTTGTSGAATLSSGVLNIPQYSGGGGGDTITSPNSTLSVGGTATNTTLDLSGAAGKIMAGATPALTYTPEVGVDNSNAGTISTANGAANAHTSWGSAATTTNTILGPATVLATLHIPYCVTASTTCTLTDTGYAYNAIPAADIASGALVNGMTATTQAYADATTKLATDAFVSNAVAGTNPATAVLIATTANLTGTYVQVGGGIGDTFTITATGATTIDGVALTAIGQPVLLKNQTTAAQNGIYTVTIVGTTGISTVFTRALDYDTVSDVNNTGPIFVQSGTANAITSWLLTSQVTSIGSSGSSLTYSQSSSNPSNLVLAVSPGIGIAHFAGSTQTVTSSLIVAADITSNTITGTQLASSLALTTPNIGAATGTSLLVTGILDGEAPITITTGTTANLGSTYNSGYTFNQEGTAGTGVTYTLPATATGKQYCVQNSGTTSVVNIGVLTVYPPASSYVILNGVVNTVGGGGTHGVASGGAAGDSACFVAVDSTHWEVFVGKGTWTEN